MWISGGLRPSEDSSDEVDELRASVTEEFRDLGFIMLDGFKFEMSNYVNEEMENREKRLIDRLRAVVSES